MITGVRVIKQEVFKDKRGEVCRIARGEELGLLKFNEVYASRINPGIVKGWKNHTRITVCFYCIEGEMEFWLKDSRKDSATYGNEMFVRMISSDPKLLIVPPGVWNGFKAIGQHRSTIINCAPETTRSEEYVRLATQSFQPWDDMSYD